MILHHGEATEPVLTIFCSCQACHFSRRWQRFFLRLTCISSLHLQTPHYTLPWLILTPVIRGPYLIWIWTGSTIVLFVQSVVLWFRYRRSDVGEFMLTEETEDKEREEDESVGGNRGMWTALGREAPRVVKGWGTAFMGNSVVGVAVVTIHRFRPYRTRCGRVGGCF